MNTSVREIFVSSEPDSSYFLRVDGSGRGLASGFQLLLTDGRNAWSGEVSAAVLSEEASELEMEMEKYMQDVQQALMQSGDAYGFSLTPSPPQCGTAVTLTYDKVQGDIAFRLGSALLMGVAEPAAAVRALLSHSLQTGNTLQQHNHRLKEENQQLEAEHQRITAELKRYTGGKEALEAELFSRFILVLNEKKAKIRSLQEAVKDLQEARSCDGQQEKEDHQASGQEDYGGSTDEDAEQVKATTTPTLTSAPAAQECTTPSPLGESLSDITDVAPSRKRRIRHLGPPEAAAVKQPQSQSSHRVRSSPPAAGGKRSSDAAAEDLFDDF